MFQGIKFWFNNLSFGIHVVLLVFFLLWLPWRFILLLSLPALDAVTEVSTMDLELEVCGIHTGGTWTDSFVEPGGYMDSFVHVEVCSVHTGGIWTDRQLCRAWELHGFFLYKFIWSE